MKPRSTVVLVLLGLVLAAGLVARGWKPLLRVADAGDFSPPDADQRRQAIGPTGELPELLRRAFSPGTAFDPIPSPAESDWLARHREPGQTYPQFVRGVPQRPDRHRNRIYLLPLGEFTGSSQPDLEALTDFATRFFALPITMRAEVSLTDLPIKRRRAAGAEQLLSPDVLDWLKSQLPEDAFCLLAVTMHDLYPGEGWNFVFGQASLTDRVGVYSFARYTKPDRQQRAESDRALILRRSGRVMAHETGHMFGLRHCIYFRCLMNGSNHLRESDRQPLHLCPVCLRKLHASVGFDMVERYHALHDFAESAEWHDEAAWLRARIESLGVDTPRRVPSAE